jgi:diaminopimelate decarboxylase
MRMDYFTKEVDFYCGNSPEELLKRFGSPLYVYNEKILRQKCRDMKNLLPAVDFKANFSTKANSNLRLLQIIREEGLNADAMSPGEIFVLMKAGFRPEEIFYVSNNVSEEEMLFAIQKRILTSVDSLSQLEMYGSLNPGGKIAVRFNPGVGAGHHEKVITGGKKTKFGVNPQNIGEVKAILKKYNLYLAGINQHIGSLFMEGHVFVEGVKAFLNIAKEFDGLEFVDMGGGFGIPYKKQQGEKNLPLEDLKIELTEVVQNWLKDYGQKVSFKTEPGRYVVAEAGVILGRVHTVKYNAETKYIGTDIGFNILKRPVMYDSYHELEVYRNGKLVEGTGMEKVHVVGNICETGDVLARNRDLVPVKEGDVLAVLDAGAYGFCMSSNYNNRLRPAEVLINSQGEVELIRKRENLEDLVRNF